MVEVTYLFGRSSREPVQIQEMGNEALSREHKVTLEKRWRIEGIVIEVFGK